MKTDKIYGNEIMQQQRKQSKKHSGSDQKSNPRPTSYTNPDNGLRVELVDSEARNEAQYLKGMSSTQLRRFFGAAKEKQAEMSDSDDNKVKVIMAILNAKAHYTARRDEKNEQIAKFFSHHLKLVSTTDDFNHFMQHFEAVVAFHYYYFNRKLIKGK